MSPSIPIRPRNHAVTRWEHAFAPEIDIPSEQLRQEFQASRENASSSFAERGDRSSNRTSYVSIYTGDGVRRNVSLVFRRVGQMRWPLRDIPHFAKMLGNGIVSIKWHRICRLVLRRYRVKEFYRLSNIISDSLCSRYKIYRGSWWCNLFALFRSNVVFD